ncbi:hypothetical protein GQ457_06G009740 [Hibiscus cannabinus]
MRWSFAPLLMLATSCSRRPWKLWEIFSDFDMVCLLVDDVCFVHVFHEANEMVDELAKEGVDRISLGELPQPPNSLSPPP